MKAEKIQWSFISMMVLLKILYGSPPPSYPRVHILGFQLPVFQNITCKILEISNS